MPRKAKLSDLLLLLKKRGLSIEQLYGQVEDVFGTPLLILASGSAPQGLANANSDIDLDVVVETGGLTQLPLLSFENGCRIEVQYHSSATVSDRIAGLMDPWPPNLRSGRVGWLQRAKGIHLLVRLASAVKLRGVPEWEGWYEQFDQPWVQSVLAKWWGVESLRYLAVARWLNHQKPILSGFRYSDAVLQALRARAAMMGETYLPVKWLVEQLQRLGDAEGIEMARHALRIPTDRDSVALFGDQCEGMVNQALADVGLPASPKIEVWYAPDVRIRAVAGGILASRWDISGVFIKSTAEGRAAMLSDPALAPIYEGDCHDDVPSFICELVEQDLVWIGVAFGSGN